MLMIDLFISHASEDSEAVARPLAQELRRRGRSVWFDEFELMLGDSLVRTIDRGLAEARFGLVILSPAFFSKEWPRRELDALTAREIARADTLILPVWHEVDHAYVAQYSPLLADKLAVNSSAGLEAMVNQIDRVLSRIPTDAGPLRPSVPPPHTALPASHPPERRPWYHPLSLLGEGQEWYVLRLIVFGLTVGVLLYVLAPNPF